MLHELLRKEKLVLNHKRTERLYRDLVLTLRRKARKKLPAVARACLSVAQNVNQHWSMDFIHDQLSNGRRFRCLTLVDQFSRQCQAIRVEHSIGGINMVETLEQPGSQKGLPQTITLDNGPEFTSKALHLWAQNAGVNLHHIEPGKPVQNAYIESFNGKFRNECLNQHWFSNLARGQATH